MLKGRQVEEEEEVQPPLSSSPSSSNIAGPSHSLRHSLSNSRSPSISPSGDDDDDEDGSQLSSELTEEEEEEGEEEDVYQSPLKQAHLTPHRPSRARKMPARFEDDVPNTVVPVPGRGRSSKGEPRQRVTVEIRTGTVKARGKGAFTDLTAGNVVEGEGKGKGKWVATIVTSDSGSGEGDEEASKEPTRTTSRIRKPRNLSPELVTLSSRKGIGQVSGSDDRPAAPLSTPTTPSKAKAKASTTAASANRSAPVTPKSHPKPIKRPRLADTGTSTPRRKRSRTTLGDPSPSTAAIFEPSKPFVQPTSADYYFAAHAARRRSATSKSDRWAAEGRADGQVELPALSSKEVAKLSSYHSSTADPLSSTNIGSLALHHYRLQYPSWTSLLFMGNDLIFHGLGAKEMILEDFARTKAEEGQAAVVIVRGRMGLRSEEWIESIEDVLDLGTPATSQGGLEGRLRRIATSLEEKEEEDHLNPSVAPRLLLVLHSLDSPSFLTPRARSHLATLAFLTRKVHIIASVTHPNSLLLSRYAGREALWIDCTTLLPMLDDCLLSAAGTRLGGLPRAFDLRAGGGMGGLTGMGSRSGIKEATVATTSGVGSEGGGGGGGMTSAASEAAGGHANTPLLSSTAALHVLKSVTTKARALFLRLASELTTSSAFSHPNGTSSSSSSTTTTTSTSTSTSINPNIPLSARSIPYSRLSTLASRNFIATSDPALRSLLVEFTSHGLIRLHRSSTTPTATASASTNGSGSTSSNPVIQEHVSIRMDGWDELQRVIKGVKDLPG